MKNYRPAFSHLAPGSDILRSYLTSDDVPPEQRTDMKKIIRKLNVEDWAAVIGAFDRWPFAPEVHFSISTLALANMQFDFRNFWSQILSAETTVYKISYDIALAPGYITRRGVMPVIRVYL